MKKFGHLTALAAVFAILLAVNLTASITLDSVDLDLTEEKLYTLSEGSAKIAEDLDTDVKIKFFYSRNAASDVPRLRQYAGRVEGLLEQFEAASGGNVTYESIEPLPDGFIIEGPTVLCGTAVDCQGDHRLAMALAVAGLVAERLRHVDAQVMGGLCARREHVEALVDLGRMLAGGNGRGIGGEELGRTNVAQLDRAGRRARGKGDHR